MAQFRQKGFWANYLFCLFTHTIARQLLSMLRHGISHPGTQEMLDESMNTAPSYIVKKAVQTDQAISIKPIL